MVSGAPTSNTGPNRNMSSQQYSQNLEAEPEAFLEDDDNSDDDIGKPMGQGLDYDSDEKHDEEASPNINQNNSGELIDLGSSNSNSGSKMAKNIPRLSGPN